MENALQNAKESSLKLFELKEQLSPIEEAVRHVHFLHEDSDGYIGLCRKEKSLLGNSFVTEFHRVGILEQTELESILSGFVSYDSYITMNTFYRKSRLTHDTRQLRALYVDIDCYNESIDPLEALELIEENIFSRNELPLPNLVTYTGMGLNFVWLIEDIPYKTKGMKAYKLWSHLQAHFIAVFDSIKIGIDKKCRDASRVFRIAGSINSKNGNRVQVQYIHEYKYKLGADLQRHYLPPPEYETTTKQSERHRGPNESSDNVKQFKKLSNRSLYYARMADIHKLVDLRAGKMEGLREITCFVFRYWALKFTGEKETALLWTRMLNSKYEIPLDDYELETATTSAEKKEYRYKNETLLELLEVTEAEQKELKTIIGKDEKKRRDKLKKREMRNSVSKEEYEQQLTDNREGKLNELRELMTKHPTAKNTELMSLLNVSKAHFYRLKKEL